MKVLLQSHIVSYAIFLGKGSQNSRSRIYSFQQEWKSLLYTAALAAEALLTIFNYNSKWASTPRASSLSRSWVPALCHVWLMAGCTWGLLSSPLWQPSGSEFCLHLLCLSVCQLHSNQNVSSISILLFPVHFNIHYDSLQPHWLPAWLIRVISSGTNYWFY